MRRQRWRESYTIKLWKLGSLLMLSRIITLWAFSYFEIIVLDDFISSVILLLVVHGNKLESLIRFPNSVFSAVRCLQWQRGGDSGICLFVFAGFMHSDVPTLFLCDLVTAWFPFAFCSCQSSHSHHQFGWIIMIYPIQIHAGNRAMMVVIPWVIPILFASIMMYTVNHSNLDFLYFDL